MQVFFYGGGTVNKSYKKWVWIPEGGGCGRGICPLPREARKHYLSIKEIKTMLVLVLYLYVQLKIALQDRSRKSICTVLLDEQIVSGLKLLRKMLPCASNLSHIVIIAITLHLSHK